MGTIRNGWKQLHWSLKTGSILAGLYLLYIVLGFFVLPPLAGHLIEDTLGKTVSRRVVVTKVSFNPFLFHAKVEGLKVYGADNATIDLSFASLEAEVQVSALLSRGLVLKAITLDTPYVFLQILDNKGSSNLAKMFQSKEAAPPPEPEKDEDSALFPVIVEGIFCHNGTLRVQDDPKSRSHVIDQIDLTVPFFSSRPDDIDIKVTPLLSFRLNETPFTLKGHSVPFAPGRRTEFDLTGAGLDLTHFWSYVPIGPSLTLSAGRFTSDASLIFEQTPQGKRPFTLFLKGDFRLNDIELIHAGDGKILACRHARAVLEKFHLLPREAIFSEIVLDDPFVFVERRDQGALNWSDYLHEIQSGTNQDAPAAPPQEEGPALRVAVTSFRLKNGQIRVRDQAVQPEFATTLHPLNIRIDHLDTAKNAATVASLRVRSDHGVHFAVNATMVLDPLACNGSMALTNASIPTYESYFAPFIPLEVARGTVDCALGFQIAGGESPEVRLSDIKGNVAGVGLTMPKSTTECLGFSSFSFDRGEVDLNEHRVGFSRMVLTRPLVKLERDKAGEIDLVALFASSPATKVDGSTASSGNSKPAGNSASGTTPSPAVAAANPALETHLSGTQVSGNNTAGNSPLDKGTAVPWSVGIDAIECVDGELVFTDRAVPTVAVTSVNDIDLTLEGAGSDLQKKLDFQLALLVNGKGTVAGKGSLVPATSATQGTVRVEHLALSAVNPYMPSSVKIDVAKGALGLDGSWDLYKKDKELKGEIKGTVDVDGLLLKDLGSKKDLFGFTAFTLAGIDLHLAPNTLHMDSIVLKEPRTFLEKDEKGVLNLVRVTGGDGEKTSSEPETEAKPVPAKKASKKASKKPATSATPTTSADQPSFFTKVDVDTVRIIQGEVAFHDRSLSPDFTASLDQINTLVTNVSLDPAHKAFLDFNATVNKHAPISLKGELSPLRRPLASDLAFRLSHMDMTSLTPYTLKSLAYPVLKGKLNWNGNFSTENYALAATNTFFVEQFELGEKVNAPDAPSIPIKLGLALLQDGKGDLTLNVPVQGKLNDPAFRLGGVIFKAIMGVFSKIVTAPFALIGSMFGGGDDLSHLDYAAGSFALSPPTHAKLDTVIKALQQRPKLRVFATGTSEEGTDRVRLEEDAFTRKLKLQKYNVLEGKGQAPAEGVKAVNIAPEEYEQYLFLAYKAEPGEKPHKFGVVERLPLEEMEAIVRQNITVSNDDLLELANKRSRTVQQYLLEQGAIAPDRVFVTSSKLLPAGGSQAGMRVDLSLGQ